MAAGRMGGYGMMQDDQSATVIPNPITARPRSLDEERERQAWMRAELGAARESERRRTLSGPRPEETVRPPMELLEGGLHEALRGELEPIRKALRELAESLKDELLASRVREIVAKVGDGTPNQILAAWGEIQWILELEDGRTGS